MPRDHTLRWQLKQRLGAALSLKQRIQHPRRFEADPLAAKVDAGERRPSHLGEQDIIINAEHGDFFRHGDAAFTAGVDGVPGISIVARQQRARSRQRAHPFLRHLIGGGRAAEERFLSTARLGECVAAHARP